MNVKRWVLAGLGAFAVVFVLDFIVHGKLLMGLYEQTTSVWRPQAESNQKMWLMMVGQLLFGLLFARIYTYGYEASKAGVGQGVRYGFLIGFLLSISYLCVWYVVLPIPFSLAIGWAASMMANSLGAGTVVGLIYR